MNLSYRKAGIRDLKAIIDLLKEDELGSSRESSELDQSYIEAFHQIDQDPHQYLMIVELDGQIVGTCHLTMMPSLSFRGSTRMQIEAVRVSTKHRGQMIGEWMLKEALSYGQAKGASIFQLMTNKERLKAQDFYKKLAFEATHEGMKLFIKYGCLS